MSSVFIYDLYKSSGQDEINIRSSVLKLKHLSRSTCSGQNTLSYLTPTFWNNLPTCLKLPNSFKHGVKEHFFKTLKNKEQDISIHFCLLKWHVASISISNCCLIFKNVSAIEVLILYIFDFHVVLVLVQLQVGLWVSFTFNFRFMFKNTDFLRGFFLRDHNGNKA